MGPPASPLRIPTCDHSTTSTCSHLLPYRDTKLCRQTIPSYPPGSIVHLTDPLTKPRVDTPRRLLPGKLVSYYVILTDYPYQGTLRRKTMIYFTRVRPYQGHRGAAGILPYLGHLFCFDSSVRTVSSLATGPGMSHRAASAVYRTDASSVQHRSLKPWMASSESEFMPWVCCSWTGSAVDVWVHLFMGGAVHRWFSARGDSGMAQRGTGEKERRKVRSRRRWTTIARSRQQRLVIVKEQRLCCFLCPCLRGLPCLEGTGHNGFVSAK